MKRQLVMFAHLFNLSILHELLECLVAIVERVCANSADSMRRHKLAFVFVIREPLRETWMQWDDDGNPMFFRLEWFMTNDTGSEIHLVPAQR